MAPTLKELATTAGDDILAAWDRAEEHRRDGSITRLNEASLLRLKEIGFYKRPDEPFYYVNLRPVLTGGYFTGAPAPADGVDAATVHKELYPGLAASLVFVNGRYREDLSDIAGLSGAATIKQLSQLSPRDPMAEKAAELASGEKDRYGALNGAFASEQVVVEINGDLKGPVMALNYLTGSDSPAMALPRLCFHVADDTVADILFKTAGTADGMFVNYVTELEAGRGAKINFYLLQADSGGAHFGRIRTLQKKNSTIHAVSAMRGGPLTRHAWECRIKEEGAHLDLNGVAVLKDKEQAHVHVNVHHLSQGSTSNQLFRNILQDESKTSVDTTVNVARDAVKTTSDQLVNNLMLSPNAFAGGKPTLMIHADDVKCTHGCTVGQINDEQLFYLKTRGINEDLARGLLTASFANMVLDKAAFEPFREEARKMIADKLPG